MNAGRKEVELGKHHVAANETDAGTLLVNHSLVVICRFKKMD